MKSPLSLNMDGKYRSADGRFTAERHYRPARRGPNDSVPDGWLLHDAVTDTTWWLDSLGDARRPVTRWLADEERARLIAPQAVAWRAAPGHGSEVRLIGPMPSFDIGAFYVIGGQRYGSTKVGVVDGRDLLANARRLLDHLGVDPDLRRLD